MQVHHSRTAKSQKIVVASMLTAAVAGLAMFTSRAQADSREWSATPSVAGLWSTPTNWTTGTPIPGDSLVFRNTSNFNPVNDLAVNTLITGMTFDSGTSSYNVTGNIINFSGDLTNLTGVNQTIGMDINTVTAPTNINTGGGTITMTGALTGNQNILKNDSGTLVLTGVSTRTGLFQVNNGAVLLTGRLNDTTANSIQIAPTAGQTGAIYVNGGTLNAGGDLRVGFADGASGFLRINNGVVTSGAQTLVRALNTTGSQRYGGLSLNGGTLTSSTYVVIGFNNNIATYRQTDGFASLTGNALLTIGAGGNTSIGNMDIMGGRFDVITGESGSGRSVKSRKQAIAIGLSEARKKGAKVPRKSSGRKRSGGRKRSSR